MSAEENEQTLARKSLYMEASKDVDEITLEGNDVFVPNARALYEGMMLGLGHRLRTRPNGWLTARLERRWFAADLARFSYRMEDGAQAERFLHDGRLRGAVDLREYQAARRPAAN